MSFREKLKKNKFFHFCGIKVLNFYFFYIEPIIEFVDRLFMPFRKKYRKLKIYKNMYLGKRCFLVCTGPSLTFEDLDAIKDEYSLSMNSIIKVLDKTQWQPTIYGIQDYDVFEKLKECYSQYNNELFFVSHRIGKKFSTVLKNKKTQEFKLYYHGTKRNLKRPHIKFSRDITKGIYNGYSITYSLIQIAIYMGFREIYLLGCDSNYDPNPTKRYFVSHGHFDPNAQNSVRFQMKAFSVAKKYAEKHGVQIFNATRGGKLEVFKRISLEDVLKHNDK